MKPPPAILTFRVVIATVTVVLTLGLAIALIAAGFGQVIFRPLAAAHGTVPAAGRAPGRAGGIAGR